MGLNHVKINFEINMTNLLTLSYSKSFHFSRKIYEKSLGHGSFESEGTNILSLKNQNRASLLLKMRSFQKHRDERKTIYLNAHKFKDGVDK